MNAYSLLLDIGGTDLKIACAKNGFLTAESVRRFGMPKLKTSKSGSARLEPGKVLGLVVKTINDFIKEFGEPQQILISGQMGSWILTDDDGEYFTEIVSWQDTAYFQTKDERLLEVYGNQYCPELKNLKDNGGEDWPGAPWRGFAFECLNLQSHRTYLFHTLTSWVAWELTGRVNHLIHVTDAAASGMLNIKNNKWFDLSCGLDTAVAMPRVVMDMEIIGYSPEFSIPVLVAVGDQQASLLGAGLANGIAILNAGTGGQVAKLVTNMPQTKNKIRPYFEGKYMETITHIPSGRFIAKFLAKANDFHNTNFDWDWLWQDSEYSSSTLISPNLDWNYENFLDRYFNNQESIAKAKNIFLGELLKNFSVALTKLDLKDIKLIILAGGVAQKWKIMKQEIQKEFGISVKVSQSEETTLNGLAILESRIVKLGHFKKIGSGN